MCVRVCVCMCCDVSFSATPLLPNVVAIKQKVSVKIVVTTVTVLQLHAVLPPPINCYKLAITHLYK